MTGLSTPTPRRQAVRRLIGAGAIALAIGAFASAPAHAEWRDGRDGWREHHHYHGNGWGPQVYVAPSPPPVVYYGAPRAYYAPPPPPVYYAPPAPVYAAPGVSLGVTIPIR